MSAVKEIEELERQLAAAKKRIAHLEQTARAWWHYEKMYMKAREIAGEFVPEHRRSAAYTNIRDYFRAYLHDAQIAVRED